MYRISNLRFCNKTVRRLFSGNVLKISLAAALVGGAGVGMLTVNGCAKDESEVTPLEEVVGGDQAEQIIELYDEINRDESSYDEIMSLEKKIKFVKDSEEVFKEFDIKQSEKDLILQNIDLKDYSMEDEDYIYNDLEAFKIYINEDDYKKHSSLQEKVYTIYKELYIQQQLYIQDIINNSQEILVNYGIDSVKVATAKTTELDPNAYSIPYDTSTPQYYLKYESSELGYSKYIEVKSATMEDILKKIYNYQNLENSEKKDTENDDLINVDECYDFIEDCQTMLATDYEITEKDTLKEVKSKAK